jgi:DNA-directed RNA polymerase
VVWYLFVGATLLSRITASQKFKWKTCDDFNAGLDAIAEVAEKEVKNLEMIIQGVHINRKLCKLPVMTTSYSVQLLGMIRQVQKELMSRVTDDSLLLNKMTIRPAALKMGLIIFKAVKEELASITQAQDFFVNCASLFNSCDQSIMWISPSGFPVFQKYCERDKTTRVRTALNYTIYKHIDDADRMERKTSKGDQQVSIPGELNDKIKKHKQKSAIAPNIIHSYDSAHALMTVRRLKNEFGLESFAMIHDSYGVHACDVDALHKVIREEFVKIYSVDRLTEIQESFKCQILALKPDDVTQGEIDYSFDEMQLLTQDLRWIQGQYAINEVLEADRFFA